MGAFKPIKQVRVSDEIVEQLKQSILLGHFKAGDKLPSERELADEFQVSRVAVREALRSLKELGFIMTRQGATGGAYVTDLTFDHLSNAFLDLFLADKISIPELYEVRLHVEPEVARLAAMHITPEYAETLRLLLGEEEKPFTTLHADVERKMAIHFLLAEMCGNRFFEAIVRSVMGLTKRVIEVIKPEPPHLHPAGMHHPIVKAVIAGDPDGAFSAMKKHAEEYGKTLMQAEKSYRSSKSR